ncbi:lysophospholipid acyltransferase family protein [Acidicapsa dinghuensis]|uniref:Lysophospholipid acyltransferase family protein n=1 Tax=Acidicapsa dinghuensis TaxID=2218256 RepID=A0ABW1EFX5_9BACT|nr:lysophospholipid acyltransferase family protein [Acidicapsa dinghuensis]
MIASLVVLAVFVALGLPAAVVLFPYTLITGDVMPLYRIGTGIAKLGLRAAGIRLQIEGRERVPQGRACIFMANHISNLDPPLLIPNLPGRTSVFLKRSLMNIPILGYGMKLGEFVPVDRSGNYEAAIQSMRQAMLVLEKGIHITTFVEGTRSRDGRMLPFKKGPFYLALESRAPIIPVSISGTESMMHKGSMRIYPSTARIVFHAPIDPAGYEDRDALMAAVRASIASGLPEWMRT